MSLFRSAFTVSSFTLGSRILGYIRDVMIAAFAGAGALTDAFFVAFRLPNFFRQISAEGAFNAAFVPLFSGKISIDGKEKAIEFAQKSMLFMFLVLLILVTIVEIFMPQVMMLLAPGFADDSEQFALVVLLGRIMFPYLLFISLVALCCGVMQSFGKFAVAAAVPMLLSGSMIVALPLFAEQAETPVHVLAYAVLVAGVLQWLVMWVAVKRMGLSFSLALPKIDDDIKQLLRRMGPGIIGGGVMQLNVWVNTVLATTLLPGAVSYLYYADRLAQFPLALIGTAMGTALLPALSVQLKQGHFSEAITTQNRAFELTMLFALPAAIALALLAQPIISLLFERGEFSSADSLASAHALTAYALGVPAFILVKIFIPSFFAAGDTKTPVKIALICLVFNVTLNLILMQFLGHVGLAISTALSSWLNVMMLVIILKKRNRYEMDQEARDRTVKMLVAALCMGGAIFGLYQPMQDFSHESSLHLLLTVGGLSAFGAVLYFTITHLSGGFKLYELKERFRS